MACKQRHGAWRSKWRISNANSTFHVSRWPLCSDMASQPIWIWKTPTRHPSLGRACATAFTRIGAWEGRQLGQATRGETLHLVLGWIVLVWKLKLCIITAELNFKHRCWWRWKIQHLLTHQRGFNMERAWNIQHRTYSPWIYKVNSVYRDKTAREPILFRRLKRINHW